MQIILHSKKISILTNYVMLTIRRYGTNRCLGIQFRSFKNSVCDTNQYKWCSCATQQQVFANFVAMDIVDFITLRSNKQNLSANRRCIMTSNTEIHNLFTQKSPDTNDLSFPPRSMETILYLAITLRTLYSFIDSTLFLIYCAYSNNVPSIQGANFN